MTDPFRELIQQTYLEYSKSNQSYADWADKIFTCTVCGSEMKRTSMNNHLRTTKHQKILKEKYNINSNIVIKKNPKQLKFRQRNFHSLKPEIYNRNTHLTDKLPTFGINLTTCYLFDFEKFCEIYEDAKPYYNYLKLLKSKTFAQLLSDHRLETFCMYRMIDSGQVDDFGSLIPSVMKKNRPQKD